MEDQKNVLVDEVVQENPGSATDQELPDIVHELLHGRKSLVADVIEGKGLAKRTRSFAILILLLGFFAGACMGAYHSVWQAVSAGVKVPMLFVVTLAICLPVLHIFSVMLGSQLSVVQTLTLILASFALTMLVIAGFAPIVIFFMITGGSYPFLKLLHVATFAIAGVTGMIDLHRNLSSACELKGVYPKMGLKILKIWVLIFAFIGTQMAWTLRPFVGSPEQKFSVFRKQEGNFYKAVITSLGDLTRNSRD
jgi:hypothetical protein